MSKLSDFKGQKISVLTSDPSTAVEGKIWYNSTTHKLKTTISFGAGTWSSGGNLSNNRSNACSGGGTQNEAYIVGGYNVVATEEYNGSSWTSGGNMSNNRYNQNLGTMGTQNAGLIVSGNLYTGSALTAATEEYDGTSWSSGGNVITPNYYGCSAGTQNAAIKTKGSLSPTVRTTKSEIYDGTSWTSISGCVEETSSASMTGTQNAALSVGGADGRNIIEEYDGSVWTVGQLWIGGFGNVVNKTVLGTQNQALSTGGVENGAYGRQTRMYDGTAWSLATDISANKSNAAGAGSQGEALISGGDVNGLSTLEYINSSTLLTKEILLG